MSHASTGFVNWYDILGVARDATPEEIKRAWRDMAKRYHPDGNQDNPHAENLLKGINQAYDILKDPQKREAFDRQLREYEGSAERDGVTPDGGYDDEDFRPPRIVVHTDVIDFGPTTASDNGRIFFIRVDNEGGDCGIRLNPSSGSFWQAEVVDASTDGDWVHVYVHLQLEVDEDRDFLEERFRIELDNGSNVSYETITVKAHNETNMKIELDDTSPLPIVDPIATSPRTTSSPTMPTAIPRPTRKPMRRTLSSFVRLKALQLLPAGVAYFIMYFVIGLRGGPMVVQGLIPNIVTFMCGIAVLVSGFMVLFVWDTEITAPRPVKGVSPYEFFYKNKRMIIWIVSILMILYILLRATGYLTVIERWLSEHVGKQSTTVSASLAPPVDYTSEASKRIQELQIECIVAHECSELTGATVMPVFIDGMDANLANFLGAHGYHDKWQTTTGDTYNTVVSCQECNSSDAFGPGLTAYAGFISAYSPGNRPGKEYLTQDGSGLTVNEGGSLGLSVDTTGSRFGVIWTLYDAKNHVAKRLKYMINHNLWCKAHGPSDSGCDWSGDDGHEYYNYNWPPAFTDWEYNPFATPNN